MPWPLSQDYNEAIQEPAQCFTDPELKQGEAVCNALGLPVPCSGNFADVYAVQAGPRKWAVKCFTRQIPGLQERYAQISAYLQQVNLPFMVEFKFLDQGIRVRGTWYPVLKMQWVEGFALNTFVRDNVDKPQMLQNLCAIWAKLAQHLHKANLAHCDLQHGNVLLVPSKAGALGVRLVDYDGMCVPALELLKSIELGHANYQHPQRLQEGSYGLQIDRFPHLVIYTAIRALSVGGQALWQKFDNGDNLLFKQADFEAPGKSALFQELAQSSDSQVRRLTQALAQAAEQPIHQVPLLDELVEPKTTVKPQAAVSAVPSAAPRAEAVFAAPTAGAPSTPRARREAKKSSVGVAIAAGIGAVILIGGITAFVLTRGSSSTRSEPVAVIHKSEPGRPAIVEPRPTESERPPTRSLTKPASVEPKTEPEPKSEPKTTPAVELPADPKDERLPVPDNEAQVQAEKRIKQLLKADYTKADLAKDKRSAHLSLAAKLFDLATGARDNPAERYVLLREARDLAAHYGAGASALKAVNTLGKEFAINLAQARADVLEAVGKKTIQTAANKLLVSEALQVLDEVLQDDEAEAAERIFKVAQTAAKNTNIAPVMASVEERRGAVEVKQKEATQLKAAAATLEKEPEDAAANLLVGKHLCLVKGQWSTGLPLLAKGSPGKLRALAVTETTGVRNPSERVEVADGWWDLAETEKGKSKTNLRRHAAYWYGQAVASLEGLARVRAVQRIQQAQPQDAGLVQVRRPRKTARVGGGGGGPYEDVSKAQEFVVGFNLTVANFAGHPVIQSVQAVYLTAKGTREGTVCSRQGGDVTRVLAKDGFAVGGIVAKGGDRLDGFKVIFMRIKGSVLNPGDSYESPWQGGRGGGRDSTLGADGDPVIGIFGGVGLELDSLGLIQLGPPGGQSVDLLKLIDPKRDSVLGKWFLQGEALVSAPSSGQRVQIPYRPPEEYTLTLVLERKQGTGDCQVGLVADGRQFTALIDGWADQGYRSGLEDIDNRRADNNETTYKGSVLATGKPSEIICTVRMEAVTVRVDGKTIISYRGLLKRLSPNPGWKVPNTEVLFFCTYLSVYQVRKIELTSFSGQGKVLER